MERKSSSAGYMFLAFVDLITSQHHHLEQQIRQDGPRTTKEEESLVEAQGSTQDYRPNQGRQEEGQLPGQRDNPTELVGNTAG